MTSHPPSQASRRAFLKQGAALGLAGAAAPWALQLAAISEAAAATATDYKALVCVFLYGGNDYANTLPPVDAASHAAYQSLRPTLALARDTLTATQLNPLTALPDGRQYALAPQLASWLPHFNAGKLAVMLNIGTLIQPTTKAQYTAKSVALPPKLFSHNDQQSFWQSSAAEGANTGWGGRMGDLLMSGNGQSTFTCVNVSGNAVFLTGQSAVQYQVTSNGSIALAALSKPLFGSSAASEALRSLITASRTHVMEAEHTRITSRALSANTALTAALAGVPALPVTFPTGNNLASQLQMVAKMIAGSGSLGARRQVFFVSMGGFDTHDGLDDAHPALLTEVADAVDAFYRCTVSLGIQDKVTTFTASDFGRTGTANADGSDHGWGSMHFVLGGAVQGGRFYGTPPVVADNGPDDVGQARLLPTLAVDQLAAALGRWMGLSDSQLLEVLPDLKNWNASQRVPGVMG